MPVTYEALAKDVHVGDRILVDDGLIELVVLDVDAPRVTARVVHGGEVKSHKGINLPGVNVSAPSITEKDRADAAFAVEQKLDYLALSFVRRAADIAELRALVPKSVLVIAKIEKDSALENIESILRASDGVMVARGDLGVELPFEEVPIAQKKIIRLANIIGRPVITATQMLESMIEHPAPHARRSERRRERDHRWNRRGDALGRDGRRARTRDSPCRRCGASSARSSSTHSSVRARDTSVRRSSRPPRRRSPRRPTRRSACSARRSSSCSPRAGSAPASSSAHRPQVPILALTDEPRHVQSARTGVGRDPADRSALRDVRGDGRARARGRADARTREGGRSRARHCRCAVRRSGHDERAAGRARVKLTFLGTGTSFGVPQIGCNCARCRSTDPRDRRTRVGAVVETDRGTRLLLDTPPELRLQLVRTASTG